MEKEYQKDFWRSPILEELAEVQHVKPLDDVTKLYNTWSGEIDDGFEYEIEKLQHPFREITNERI